MRIQLKTLLLFASPLLLAILAAYLQWIVFGLPVITLQAQPPPVGQPQGFPGLVDSIQHVGKGEGGYNEDVEYFGESANI